MRILLTNDDGLHAPGLQALERIAAQLSDDVWICAPASEQSGAGRALTLDEPIRVIPFGPRRYAVRGTPTDCVMMAVLELMKDSPPDLVLSGVNNGSNLCEDVTMSGTVAGAIEGMALGIPSIALSQVERRVPGEDFFASSEAFAPTIIRRLLSVGWPSDVVISINFPSRPLNEIEGVAVTRQGVREKYIRRLERRADPGGRDYYWVTYSFERMAPPEGSELRAIYDRKISVTPLHIDLTHDDTIAVLKPVVEAPL